MKRHQIEIMAQILAFCVRGRRKTRIMYENNLSQTQLKTYLTLLTSRDLLAHNLGEYMTTEKGHRFLGAFAQLNDVLEDRERRAFLEIISKSHGEGDRPYGVKRYVMRRARSNPVKKAAIVVFIKLAHQAERKTSEELEAEVHEALEEGFARIPWAAVEKVIVIEE